MGMHVPMAAFNVEIIVLPDMTVVDERVIPADVAPAVLETIHAHGLYAWIYRATEWYITDPRASHAERESRTVRFPPTVDLTLRFLADKQQQASRLQKITGTVDLGMPSPRPVDIGDNEPRER